LPNAFWERKKHIITLPYEKDFNEKQIPTKACPTQMNTAKKKFKLFWRKNLFVLQNHLGVVQPSTLTMLQKRKWCSPPRVNYRPLNKTLQWIRYPIPNKRDLLNRLYDAKVFCKFDMKSSFWQIQVAGTDRYKTAFTVPFGHYEWNVMPFGLKNAPSEF